MSTPFRAHDKLGLLLALVPYLLDHHRVSVTDAASHFAVTPQQIRDAVQLIAVSGIPGDSKQYQHGDLFDIAWDDFLDNDAIVLTHQVAIDETPRFSAREAAALIAGLQYLAAMPEHGNREAIASLMAKLTRGSSATPSQLAVAETGVDDERIGELSVLRTALEEGTQVQFDYLNARGDREARRVDPLRLESIDQDWYLRGWCHLRQAVRTFRLDRMRSVEGSDAPITQREELVLPNTLFNASENDLLVELELPAAALPLLSDYLTPGVRTKRIGDRMHVTIRVQHFHGLKRLVAGLPGLVTVISPLEARHIVSDWAASAAAQYPPADDVAGV